MLEQVNAPALEGGDQRACIGDDNDFAQGIEHLYPLFTNAFANQV